MATDDASVFLGLVQICYGNVNMPDCVPHRLNLLICLLYWLSLVQSYHAVCLLYTLYLHPFHLLQIMLAYSGGNHYDSVYSAQHMKNTAFCQGKICVWVLCLLTVVSYLWCVNCSLSRKCVINGASLSLSLSLSLSVGAGLVYEMLFCRVLRDHMPPHCQQRLGTLQEADFEQLRKLWDPTSTERPLFRDRSTHLLSTHYTVEELESMAANMYRNTALDVHHREKASE